MYLFVRILQELTHVGLICSGRDLRIAQIRIERLLLETSATNISGFVRHSSVRQRMTCSGRKITTIIDIETGLSYRSALRHSWSCLLEARLLCLTNELLLLASANQTGSNHLARLLANSLLKLLRTLL